MIYSGFNWEMDGAFLAASEAAHKRLIPAVDTKRGTTMPQEHGNAMSNQVYEHLKDLILSQQIKPGEKIPEAKIAAQFGFSRTPIREAIKQLANDGIVTLYPNRFAEVAVFSGEWLQEVGIVRLALDTVAARLAILHGSNYDYSVMEAYNERCLSATRAGDVAQRIKMNCAFHLELSRIGKNVELYDMQKRLYLKLEFAQACHYSNVQPEEEQYRQHAEMIRALYDRDEERLITLLATHEHTFHNMEKDPAVIRDINLLFAPVPRGGGTDA